MPQVLAVVSTAELIGNDDDSQLQFNYHDTTGPGAKSSTSSQPSNIAELKVISALSLKAIHGNDCLGSG